MKNNTWIKPGAKVLIAKFNPFRFIPLKDVKSTMTEATIEKVGSKYFYINGASFDKNTCRSTGNFSYGTRVYRDMDHLVETYDTIAKKDQIEDNLKKCTPEQIRAIHAIMFPLKQGD